MRVEQHMLLCVLWSEAGRHIAQRIDFDLPERGQLCGCQLRRAVFRPGNAGGRTQAEQEVFQFLQCCVILSVQESDCTRRLKWSPRSSKFR